MDDYFRFGRNKQDKSVIYRHVLNNRQLTQGRIRPAALLIIHPLAEFAPFETTAEIINCFGNPLFEVNPRFPT